MVLSALGRRPVQGQYRRFKDMAQSSIGLCSILNDTILDH
jgi:hypothetical protein